MSFPFVTLRTPSSFPLIAQIASSIVFDPKQLAFKKSIVLFGESGRDLSIGILDRLVDRSQQSRARRKQMDMHVAPVLFAVNTAH